MHGPIPAAGAIVWIRQRRWRVERARLDRGVVRLDVADRLQRLTFLAPFDRPVGAAPPTRPRTIRPQQAAARLAGLFARAGSVGTPISAVRASIALHPHQLEPVLAVLAGARRILVADDVGLGKTVQAGLVLAEVVAREGSPAALVIVPASLRAQWTRELELRFGIAAMNADRDALDRLARTGWRDADPWQRSNVWIASLDFLKQRHVRDALPLRPWDLVIVDEAHEACGDSERHETCAAILRRARRVVLLTATPHSGDQTRFNRLVELGDLGNAADDLVLFRRTRMDLGWPVDRRVRWTALVPSGAEAAVLDGLRDFERWMLAEAGTSRRDTALLLLSVFRKRALSTMTALARSIERRLDWLEAGGHRDAFDWLQPRLGFEEDDGDDIGADARAGLAALVSFAPALERTWLARLHLLARAAVSHESKVTRLARLVRRTREPAVIFTEFRDSLRVLSERLRPLREVAELHGGQTPAERTHQLDRFLEGRASVLVATDVAGQGLNLQRRARWVISLELPWDPAKIAQRVGRVDRIGQPLPVHATLLVTRHEAEAGLLTRLAKRALTARQAFSASALEDVAVPAQMAIAASLVAHEAEPAASSPPGVPRPVCGRWSRRGRAAARLLSRKRRLAWHWRGAGEGSRPARAEVRRAHLPSAPAPAVAIFRTPIVNAVGEIVEPHVTVVAVAAPESAFLRRPEVLARVAELAGAALNGRVARLHRVLARAATDRASIDAAIGRFMRPVLLGASPQPGLFANRTMSSLTTVERRLKELAEDTEARQCRDAAAVELSVAPPALEVVVVRAR
jgi:superfamily II DNA or RNA helicase